MEIYIVTNLNMSEYKQGYVSKEKVLLKLFTEIYDVQPMIKYK